MHIQNLPTYYAYVDGENSATLLVIYATLMIKIIN